MPEELKKRSGYLDVLRIIACFFVIVNHTCGRVFLAGGPSFEWYASLTWFFLSKTAVPVFLMITGAVLLPKSDTYGKTYRRLLRIVLVIVIFSAVYFIYGYLRGERVFDIREYLRDTYRNGITNAYWYLYLYAAILVMMPILQRLAKTLRTQEFRYIMLWSIGFLGLMPILIHFFPWLEYNPAFALPIFSVYIGLMFAGHYANKKLGCEKKRFITAVAVLIVSTAVSVILTLREYRAGEEWYLFFDNRFFITVASASVSLFYIVKYIWGKSRREESGSRALALMGRCTFGVFLLSDLFISLFEPVYSAMAAAVTPVPAVIAYEVLVYAAGLAVTLILTRIPLVNRLV
ncbi:MAG: acyltransferase [Oscillospiraceae bacterium]|nr:acyltransferase [Oscillospiraceae bacterium]